MSNYKVELNPQVPISVQVKPNRSTVTSVQIAKSASIPLAQISDVDSSDPNDGETLVYNASTGLYVIQILPFVRGGTF